MRSEQEIRRHKEELHDKIRTQSGVSGWDLVSEFDKEMRKYWHDCYTTLKWVLEE